MSTQAHSKKKSGKILRHDAGATAGLTRMPAGPRPPRADMNKVIKKKIAIFDIDGTIFRSSLLIQFNKGLINMGVLDQKNLADILDAYYAWVERRGSYTDYINRVV